jgi:hypothetical protein
MANFGVRLRLLGINHFLVQIFNPFPGSAYNFSTPISPSLSSL